MYLHTLKKVCAVLGIPLALEMEDGPTSVLAVLGIMIDAIKGELRLPTEKLQRLLQTVSEWAGRKKVHSQGAAVPGGNPPACSYRRTPW